jgi:hypothetical protein
MDIADISRTVIRWVLTVGAAIVFLGFVLSVCADAWVGKDKIEVGAVFAAVTISLSLTFGSAFVGWFGLTDATAGLTLAGVVGMAKLKRILRWIFGSLAGAAIFAMGIYLVAGAIAGLTYIAHESTAPEMLVIISTAWAAQVSAIIASTLAKALPA